MDYLTLVQEAMKKAGVREDVPTTLVGATGIVSDFVGYVADTYRHIQNTGHAESWFFRQSFNQTLALADGVEEYAMPSGLQSINWRTCTIYETARTDEAALPYIDYYTWRRNYYTRTVGENRPIYITVSPEDKLYVFPIPDKVYTVHFDGILDIDEMSVDADVPIIPTRYQWAIVWGAVMRFAKHHEDGAKLADAKDEYQPIYDAMTNYQLPDSKVTVGHLYGERRRDVR